MSLTKLHRRMMEDVYDVVGFGADPTAIRRQARGQHCHRGDRGMMAVNNPEALGWKRNHAPGIRTKAGVLAGWPSETLGPPPTQAQLDRWEAEWSVVRLPENTPTQTDDVVTLLNGLSVLLGITDADIDAALARAKGDRS